MGNNGPASLVDPIRWVLIAIKDRNNFSKPFMGDPVDGFFL